MTLWPWNPQRSSVKASLFLLDFSLPCLNYSSSQARVRGLWVERPRQGVGIQQGTFRSVDVGLPLPLVSINWLLLWHGVFGWHFNTCRRSDSEDKVVSKQEPSQKVLLVSPWACSIFRVASARARASLWALVRSFPSFFRRSLRSFSFCFFFSLRSCSRRS